VRAWEGWNPANPSDVVDHAGRELRVSHRVESVAGDWSRGPLIGASDNIVTVAGAA
jgi:hypothetical protein